MPLADIARAAQVYRAEVVALSFSSAYFARRIPEVLRQLRTALPARMEVWAGGAAVRRLPAIDGVQLLPQLQHAVAAVQACQARN